MIGRWAISLLVCVLCMVSQPSATASFQPTNYTAKVLSPPEGTRFHTGDWMTQYSEHSITIRRTDANPPNTCWWRGRNYNNQNNAQAVLWQQITAGQIRVGQEKTYHCAPGTKTRLNDDTGGFIVDAWTDFRQGSAPWQGWTHDVHNFFVDAGGGKAETDSCDK